MGVNRTNTEQFQLRLPPGLRDRIKAYAERHGRSTNAEIVRVLEREFPDTWPLADQITQLLALSNTLKETIGGEDLNRLGDTLLKTVEGVASGRITGVDDGTREAVAEWLSDWKDQLDESHRDEYTMSLDEEELRTLERFGTTAKFVSGTDEEL